MILTEVWTFCLNSFTESQEKAMHAGIRGFMSVDQTDVEYQEKTKLQHPKQWGPESTNKESGIKCE